MKKLPLLLAVLLGLLAFWTGCANQGSGPDGGPYDETPPHIVSMSAPEKVGHNKKVKFSLTFNELIKVDNPSEKIIVSPPQIEQPEIKVSGRKITVELLDSMIPNTTYTVDFSDAITDNNEGNPLGQYTYIFSTGVTTDTMQMSGHILNAEDLEPVKGILAGLHFDASDTAFTRKPFDRVARTDADGYFSIKGVNAQRNYRIYALQDADGDFRYTQPTELIGWLNTPLTASSRPDVRYDTAWVDSTRYDSIRTIHFTHFLPDDIVVRAFKVDYRPRHFLKYTRDVPEWFTLFFTGPSRLRPRLRGLNFDAARSLFPIANCDNDTLTYWLTDTTLCISTHCGWLALTMIGTIRSRWRAAKRTHSKLPPRPPLLNALRQNKRNWPSGKNSANADTNAATSPTKLRLASISNRKFRRVVPSRPIAT